MLYNFLNTNKNSHFFFLYGLGALQIILYRYLLIGLPIEPISLAETLVMCLLLLINISTISFIIRKNQLSEGNLLVVFFWIVISMLFPEIYKDYTVMLANTCILFVILQIMQSHNITDGRQVFFDISVLIFLATLFFLPSLLALFLLWLQILTSPGKKFRNSLIPLVVFVILFVILLAASLLLGWENQLFLRFYYLPKFDISSFLQYKFLPLLGILLINIMITSWLLKKSYKRYYSGFFISLILVGIVGIVLHENKNAVGWLYFTFPTALSGMMIIEGLKRHWLREALLWFFVLSLVVILILGRSYLL